MQVGSLSSLQLSSRQVHFGSDSLGSSIRKKRKRGKGVFLQSLTAVAVCFMGTRPDIEGNAGNFSKRATFARQSLIRVPCSWALAWDTCGIMTGTSEGDSIDL